MDCYIPPGTDVRPTVLLSSAVFNVLNFLLFDIVLASIVFWLTADVAGLVNSASALRQLGNRLHAYNPPLVGVGLTCTRRSVFRVLALIRGVAMLGVLATNFLIEGVSCERLRFLEQSVVVPAIIPLNTTQANVRRLTLRRRGCQGRTESEVYYGELRYGEHCELRRDLFSMPQHTVFFGLDFVNRTIKFPTEECEFYTDNETHRHMHRFRCNGLGTIGCEISAADGKTVPEKCVGMVYAEDHLNKTRQVEYMCEGEALFPGKFGKSRTTDQARCRMARNANVTDTSWVPLINNKAKTLRDIIDAVYGAGFQNTSVPVVGATRKEREEGLTEKHKIEVTQLDYAYFWVLGAKVGLILLLILIDILMRAKGLIPAAHNEFGLGSLLAQSTANAIRIGDDDMPIEEEATRDETMQLLVQSNNGVIRAHSVRR